MKFNRPFLKNEEISDMVHHNNNEWRKSRRTLIIKNQAENRFMYIISLRQLLFPKDNRIQSAIDRSLTESGRQRSGLRISV